MMGNPAPGSESLLLKWGTLKGWDLKSEHTKALMQKYIDLGASYSVMARRDTDEQQQIICDLIDVIDGPIRNDWTGEVMSKSEAKKYILEYRTKASQ